MSYDFLKNKKEKVAYGDLFCFNAFSFEKKYDILYVGGEIMGKIVCFTGHRTVSEAEYPALHALLQRTVEEQILQGASCFRTGGALGFDTMAALCVLSLRLRYPHVQLELVLPCPSQTEQWSPSDVCLYNQILAQADRHRYVSQAYFSGVLQMRNRALVDGADLCIAFLRTSHGGGAAYTASYALKNGLEVINLADAL